MTDETTMDAAPAAPADPIPPAPVEPVEAPAPIQAQDEAQAEDNTPTASLSLQAITAAVQHMAAQGHAPGPGFGVHIVNGIPSLGPWVEAHEAAQALRNAADNAVKAAQAEGHAARQWMAAQTVHRSPLYDIERTVIVAGLAMIGACAWAVKAVLKPVPWMAEQVEGWALRRIDAERFGF
jgi:hypothetical protein